MRPAGESSGDAAPIRGGFESCIFSDDGRRLLTWNEVWEAGTVTVEARVWEARDGTLVYTSSPLATPGSLSLLPDGERLRLDVREGKGDIHTFRR